MIYEHDGFETVEGRLDIIPIHHATLVMEWNKKTIYCDPVGGERRYGSLNRPTHIVLTHHHGDHFDMETLDPLVGDSTVIVAPRIVYDQMPADMKAKTRLMANGDSAEIDGFSIKAIPMYNTTPERQKFHEKGVGNGYLFDFVGTVVYLASDTEPLEDMERLGPVDIAFFPMNLPYTMTPEQVLDCIEKVKPRTVYPFHYTAPEGQPKSTPENLAALAKDKTDTEIAIRDWYPDI